MSADSASVQFVAKSSLSASLNAEAALTAQLGAGAAVVNDYLIQTEEIEDGHRLTITRGSEVQTFDLKNGAPGSKDAVLYTPQELSADQQAQARANIGIAEQGEVIRCEVGSGRQFESFTECLRALKDDEREKIIDVYGGSYDILEELGGQDFLDGLTGAESWCDVCDVIPPNTTVVGHGRVELKMELPETTESAVAALLSPVNMMGSARLRNLSVIGGNCRCCVHCEGGTLERFNNALWELEDCRIEKTSAALGTANAVVCGLNDGAFFRLRNSVVECAASGAISIRANGSAHAASPQVVIEDCALIAGYFPITFSSQKREDMQSVVRALVANCYAPNFMRKQADEAGTKDCFEVTYVNTPHKTQVSEFLIDVIPDVEYDNYDLKKGVLYTAQSLTGAEQAQARANIGAVSADECVASADYAPVDRTSEMTQPVGRDGSGKLWTAPGSEGSGESADSVLYTAQSLTVDQQTQARKNIDCVGNIVCETRRAFQSVPTGLPGMIEDSGNALIVHGSEDAFGLPMVSNSENLFPYPYEGAKTNGNTGVTFSTYYRWITLSGDGTGSGTATFYPLGTDYRDISELGLAPGDTYRFCIKANKKPNVTTGNVELRFLSDTGSTLVNQIAYIPTNDALLTESSEYTVPEGAVLFRLRILATATAAWDDVCIYPILLKASATLDKLGAELAEGERAELPYAQIMGMAQVNTFDYEHSYRYKIDAKTYIDNHMSEAKMTYVTPEQFGAVGDGIADDAQAIAACFAEAQVQGVPVRMDQAYCTSQPVVVGSNMDVEINSLKYSGADCAVILNGAASALRVNQLDSAGMGLMLRAEDVMVQHNAVQLGSVTSKSHGISLEIADGSKMAIAQNRIDFRNITAGGDGCHCITNRRKEIPTYIPENSFFGGQCSNADWAYFGSGGNSKFYGIQVEGKIKGGFCFVGGANALIVGDRHVESMRDGEYPYLKIYSEETPSSSYSGSITGLTWISPSSISVNEIDVSGVATKNIAGDGESYITSSGSLGRILCSIGSYKETGTDSAAHYQIFGRSAIIWCNCLIFQDVPDKHYIVTKNLDLRTIDADTPGMPTVFEIDCTDCVIHLHPTYCFMGLSRFHVVQTEDYQATIYDSYSGNAIFDGSTYGAGTFEVTTRINGDNARINGEGMIWKVRRIGLNIDADGNATI